MIRDSKHHIASDKAFIG